MKFSMEFDHPQSARANVDDRYDITVNGFIVKRITVWHRKQFKLGYYRHVDTVRLICTKRRAIEIGKEIAQKNAAWDGLTDFRGYVDTDERTLLDVC